MKVFLCLICFFYLVSCKKESFSDLYSMLNDPDIIKEIEKRINGMEDGEDVFSDGEVKCYDNSGLLASGCRFRANSSTIIKTTESLERGAKFLNDFANVSCPRDCTSLCCNDKDCDTAVYQNKGDRKCYLFQCGDSSRCVFSKHSDYFMSSISKATHSSHSFTPGGLPYSHENDLENLGSHEKQPDTTPPPLPSTTTTTVVTTGPADIKFPELGEYCPSYFSRCEDPHAECLRQRCQCRVGYHQKHGIKLCRKHCSNSEFECENVYDADSRQCVSRRHVCDGHPDCTDGSDEENCPDKTKPAYLDGDGNSNFYNNPYYNSQSDSQFPYGFPIPGLTNQQQAGLNQPSNQIYPPQGTANQNTANQYYLPGLTNQNVGGINLVPGNSQMNQQWPLSNNIGSQTYQNNQAYQRGQQQSYVPVQPGLSQNPVQPVQPVQPLNPNIQPIKQNIGQNVQQVQPNQIPSSFGQQNVVPVQKVATFAPIVKPDVQNAPNTIKLNENNDQHSGYIIDHEYDTVTDAVETERNRYPAIIPSQTDDNLNNFDTESDKETPSRISGSNYAYHEGSFDTDSGRLDDYKSKEAHRHSSEEDESPYINSRTYPSAPKTKTQVVSPTHSTVPGQKPVKSHSEGFPDYSWLKYDDDSPRVSGKKGKTIDSSSDSRQTDTSSSRKQPDLSSAKTASEKSSKVKDTKQDSDYDSSFDVKTDGKLDSEKYGNNKFKTDSRYPDEYRYQYDDFRRPNNNRRPSYDRYQNRYDNTRRRPSPGTRYPYYDNGYQRGYDRDRDRYPVWDPFKDEYYYPDVYEDRHLGRAGLEYDSSAEEKQTHSRPLDSGSKSGTVEGPQFDKPKVTEPPTTPKVTDKIEKVPSTTPKPNTPEPVNMKQASSDADQSDKSDTDSQAPSNTDETDSSEPVTSEDNSGDQSKDSNPNVNRTSTDQKDKKTEENGVFEILNAESVKVETYKDSFQGPIVALALGLTITMILLIFVGCRLRTVKRRLRKGRALHSNEADYLINGMYL